MNERLTPQQEEFINKQLADGRYLSASEAIREGLRLLADEEKWKAEVRQKLVIGLEQLRAGQVVDGEAAVEKILGELRKRRTPSGG